MRSAYLAMVVMIMFSIAATCSAGEDAVKVFYAQGPRSVKAIALTFDDGPGNYTEKILSVLKQNGVKATFFMEGSQVTLRPAIAKEVAAAGHEIGNHTYNHLNYYSDVKVDREKVLATEMQKTADAIQKATGETPRLMRVPNGYIRAWVKDLALREKYTVINWSFGCDWKKLTADQLFAVYSKNLQPGAIFLMHDGGKHRQATAEMLGRLIAEARRQGYSMVTISELLNLTPQTIAVTQPAGKRK